MLYPSLNGNLFRFPRAPVPKRSAFPVKRQSGSLLSPDYRRRVNKKDAGTCREQELLRGFAIRLEFPELVEGEKGQNPFAN